MTIKTTEQQYECFRSLRKAKKIITHVVNWKSNNIKMGFVAPYLFEPTYIRVIPRRSNLLAQGSFEGRTPIKRSSRKVGYVRTIPGSIPSEQKTHRRILAHPSIVNIDIELNPMVEIEPLIRNRHEMKVIKRIAASFEPPSKYLLN